MMNNNAYERYYEYVSTVTLFQYQEIGHVLKTVNGSVELTTFPGSGNIFLLQVGEICTAVFNSKKETKTLAGLLYEAAIKKAFEEHGKSYAF